MAESLSPAENRSDPLRQEKLGNLITLCLDRPPGNRFSLDMMETLVERFEQLACHEDVRAILLEAEGEDFSFGADLQDPDLMRVMGEGEASRKEFAQLGQQLITLWDNMPVPTVCFARGRVIGAGAGLFVASDFRFVEAGTTLWFPEVIRGMHLSWGIVPLLQRECGWGWTRRLAMACEKIDPLDCAPLVVQHSTRDGAASFASQLALLPPLALKAVAETMVRGGAEDPERFTQTAGSADFTEAIVAWMEKRQGVYDGK